MKKLSWRGLLMHSAIYRGYLRHRRFHPRRHQFIYRVFMIYLDLAEVEAVFSQSRWWSDKPWRPARFKRSDFLGDPDLALDEAVRLRVLQETGVKPQGPVRMLANLRYFGFIINPITCYYCFDQQENLQTIVIEVTNTPWKERVSYVLSCDPDRRLQRITFDKKMHVSPFNPMNMKYHWTSNLPSIMLNLHLECAVDGNKRIDANMALRRQPINSKNLAMILMEYPWMTFRVALSIYWQALKLRVKGNPFYGHPGNNHDKLHQQS